MIVTLKNTGTKKLALTPTAAIPLYGRSADNIRDHRHVTSLLHRIETTKNGVILNPTLTFDERGHQKNELVYGVFGGTGDGACPVGYYPCVEDFIGEGGSFENPQAIVDPSIALVKAGGHLDGYEALGGIQFEQVTLAPCEEKTYIVVMGYGSFKEELESAAAKYLSLAACERAFAQTKAFWDEKINVSYCSGEKEFDAWMHWVHFQPMLRRIYGCSFLPHHDYGKGGRGWRDLWQDCLALLIMNPAGVKDMLLDNFGGVRTDGTNATIIGTKQGAFIADRNNITRVWMDHGVWPFLTTNLYIQQTGDLEILLEETNYFKDTQAVRGEEKDKKWKLEDGNHQKTIEGKVYQGSILEHLLIQHLTVFYDVGEHNEIKLRGADWNDALDMAKERGESVAFTAIYAGNLKQMATLLLALEQKGIEKISLAKEIMLLLSTKRSLYEAPIQKKELLHQYCKACKYTLTGEMVALSCKELAKNLNGKAAWMKNNIQTTEWLTNKEGYSWYNGYYDNNGRQVEGDFKSGVRMMLTSQVFTIMSEIATQKQVKEIAATADAYLYEESIGGYRLNTNFKEIKTDLGRMFGFAYGHKENGAVFSHMAVMYGNALYQRGFAKEGYKVIHSLYQHCSNFEQSKIYPGVPEYIGNNGRGMYHYLTGAASWLLLTVLTQMFGVKGSYGNLLFEPKLLLEQFDDKQQAKVNLLFADRKLTIVYLNQDKKEYGAYIVGDVIINDVKYKFALENAVILRSAIEALNPDENHVIIVKLV